MDHSASASNLHCNEHYTASDVIVGADVTVTSQEIEQEYREPTVPAFTDRKLLNDERVLMNMLQTEERYAPQTNCFETVQKDVEQWMRNKVAHWLLEVRQLILLCLVYVLEQEPFNDNEL